MPVVGVQAARGVPAARRVHGALRQQERNTTQRVSFVVFFVFFTLVLHNDSMHAQRFTTK